MTGLLQPANSAWWPLAPNFCSRATRLSYFFFIQIIRWVLYPGFHRLRALGSVQFFLEHSLYKMSWVILNINFSTLFFIFFTSKHEAHKRRIWQFIILITLGLFPCFRHPLILCYCVYSFHRDCNIMMQSCHKIHNVHNKSDNSEGQLK